MSTPEQIRLERIEKLEELRQQGINPYPYRFEVTHTSQQIIIAWKETEPNHLGVVTIAGRMMTIRGHGKSSFATVQDSTGKIQIYVREDEIGTDEYTRFSSLDLGDIVGVSGTVFKTKTNEISVRATRVELLAKCLRILPAKWHGLRDVEARYRQRYLDLLINTDVKDVFIKRAQVINVLRSLLTRLGGVEVETPTLQPLYGGASAKPFVSHYNALDQQVFLRISDELYLKRLIVGGIDFVYEICKDFRNEGIDRSHLPEFTMIELYWAYKDYNDMMKLAEHLVSEISIAVNGMTVLDYQGEKLDLTPPWRRASMSDLVAEHTGINIQELTDEQLLSLYHTLSGDTRFNGNRGTCIEKLFALKVEDTLFQPTFVTDHPKEISPLAKVHRQNSSLTERFELYIAGMEIADAFSELNDPIDQRRRLEAQMLQREKGDEEAQVVDEDFLYALEFGLPPTGGMGIGVDRLVMILCDQRTIQNVVLFPPLKMEEPKNGN